MSLRLSIAANIVLLGIVATLLWRDRTVTPATFTPPTRTAAVPPESKPRTNAPPLLPGSEGPRLTSAAVAQLEQMGISPDVLATVLIEDFNRRSTRRLADLKKKYAPQPVPDRAMREFSRACDAEETRELKAALGPEGYRAWDKDQKLAEVNRARAPGDELSMSAGKRNRRIGCRRTTTTRRGSCR